MRIILLPCFFLRERDVAESYSLYNMSSMSTKWKKTRYSHLYINTLQKNFVTAKVDRSNPNRKKEKDENIIRSYIALIVFNIRFEIINL